MEYNFKGFFGNDPQLGVSLDRATKPERKHMVKGDSSLLLSCNHMAPVYRYDIETLQQREKQVRLYCGRCENKNIAVKVIRMLENREAKINSASGEMSSLNLEFLDSNTMLKGHAP